MLDKKLFISLIKTMRTNFDLDKSDEDIVEYCRVVHPFMVRLEVDDKLMTDAVGNFILKTSGSNFNKLPSVGDFAKELGLQPKTLEQRATEQAELIFNSMPAMRSTGSCMFSDRVTNYILNTYGGGVKQLLWDYSPCNQDKKDEVWGRKEMEKRYISCHELGHESVEPLKLSGTGWKIFGDEALCLENAQIYKENVLQIEKKRELPKIGTKIKEQRNEQKNNGYNH